MKKAISFIIIVCLIVSFTFIFPHKTFGTTAKDCLEMYNECTNTYFIMSPAPALAYCVLGLAFCIRYMI